MSNRFLHTVSVQDQTPGADGKQVHDLPVNPLACVMLMLRPLNETSTVTNFQPLLGIANALNSIQISHRGTTIVSMTGGDAAAMAYLAMGSQMWQATNVTTDNTRRSVGIPIFLGNSAYDADVCFPASQRGELTITLDFDIADTGYDGMQYSIETIEILGAEPTHYIQQVEQRKTFDATGINDIDLPVGNVYQGILIGGGTAYAGASPAPTWGRISTLLDNQTAGYSSADFESLHALPGLLGIMPGGYDNHIFTSAKQNSVGLDFTEYGYLAFDPLRNGSMGLDASKANRFHVRADAEATGTVRLVPRELVRV